jgi:hypothetical protein
MSCRFPDERFLVVMSVAVQLALAGIARPGLGDLVSLTHHRLNIISSALALFEQYPLLQSIYHNHNHSNSPPETKTKDKEF